jgi:hypothetical protein
MVRCGNSSIFYHLNVIQLFLCCHTIWLGFALWENVRANITPINPKIFSRAIWILPRRTSCDPSDLLKYRVKGLSQKSLILPARFLVQIQPRVFVLMTINYCTLIHCNINNNNKLDQHLQQYSLEYRNLNRCRGPWVHLLLSNKQVSWECFLLNLITEPQK